MEKLESLVESYTSLGEIGNHAIIRKIIQCKWFQYQYKDCISQPSVTGQSGNDDKVLKALAKDYKESEEKEASKRICTQRAKVSNKLLNRRSMKGSRLEVNGVAVQGKSRTEIAKAIG